MSDRTRVQRATQFAPLHHHPPATPLYGRAVASVNGFGYGSCGDCLVGHWHGRLARALAEEPPVGCPVFALHGGAEAAAAEWVMQRQCAAARTLGWGQCPAQGPPMVRMGQRRWRPLPGEESGHSEPRGGVVPHGLRPRDQRGLAGLHAADVQRRDLDRGAGDLLVGQVLVQKTVHTTVHLFQIHLLVLQEEEEEEVEEGRHGGGDREDRKGGGTQRLRLATGPFPSGLLALHASSPTFCVASVWNGPRAIIACQVIVGAEVPLVVSVQTEATGANRKMCNLKSNLASEILKV